MNLDNWIEEVKGRCEKATQPPWVIEKGEIGCRDMDNPDPEERCDCHGYGIISDQKNYSMPVVTPQNDRNVMPGIHNLEDADFMFHSRTDLPKALRIIERMKKCIEQSASVGVPIAINCLKEIEEELN